MTRRSRPRRAWRKHLAATGRRVREGRPGVRSGGRGDPEIVGLVAEPFPSVEAASRRLTDLRNEFAARDDDRAVFLSIYARTTTAVADRIARGEFEDPDWVADYLVTFANHYREAVHDYEVGNHDALPDPWQLAFESAERSDSLVVQDALLGINAHINYDLAFALAEVGIDPDRRAKYEDHRAVTEVLRELVDRIQEILSEDYAPGIETIDEALGSYDERIAVFTIDECRDSAWRNAVAMCSRFGVRRRMARWITHSTSTGAAYLILGSNASGTVHGTLQGIEEGSESDGGGERAQGTGTRERDAGT